ncbi:hypothetical protein ACJJTC_018971 [Scirpophaga incertulas]
MKLLECFQTVNLRVVQRYLHSALYPRGPARSAQSVCTYLRARPGRLRRTTRPCAGRRSALRPRPQAARARRTVPARARTERPVCVYVPAGPTGPPQTNHSSLCGAALSAAPAPAGGPGAPHCTRAGPHGAPSLCVRTCGPDRAASDEPLVLVRGGAQRCARARRRPGRAALYPRGPARSAQSVCTYLRARPGRLRRTTRPCAGRRSALRPRPQAARARRTVPARARTERPVCVYVPAGPTGPPQTNHSSLCGAALSAAPAPAGGPGAPHCTRAGPQGAPSFPAAAWSRPRALRPSCQPHCCSTSVALREENGHT